MQTLSCLFLLACGIYFAVRLRAFPYLHPLRTLRLTLCGKGRRESFRALTVALAGTLGVGNITGVILALAVGGAGAIVWMWISGCLAMLIRYAEVVMALGCRGKGGDHYPDTASGRLLSRLFSLLCAAVGLTMGAGLQAGAAAESLSLAFGIPGSVTGILFLLSTGAVVLGGIRSIGKVTVLLIPLVSLLYLILTGGVIIRYIQHLPAVLSVMLRDAFLPEAAGGGTLGYLLSRRIKTGITRGLLSNEAGCGTAPIAHAAAEGVSPVRQGLWGILEVGVDTLIVSSLTAFAVLLPSGGRIPTAVGIAPLLDEVGAIYGDLGRGALVVSVCIFAYATTLAWSHYGEISVLRLLKKKRVGTLYLLFFCLSLFAGATLPLGALFSITDLLLSVMTVLNLSALMQKADRVCTLSAKSELFSFSSAHKPGCGKAADRRKTQDAQAYPPFRSPE